MSTCLCRLLPSQDHAPSAAFKLHVCLASCLYCVDDPVDIPVHLRHMLCPNYVDPSTLFIDVCHLLPPGIQDDAPSNCLCMGVGLLPSKHQSFLSTCLSSCGSLMPTYTINPAVSPCIGPNLLSLLKVVILATCQCICVRSGKQPCLIFAGHTANKDTCKQLSCVSA